MPGWVEEPEMVWVLPQPVACGNVEVSSVARVKKERTTHAVGKDRRIEAVHDMPDEFLRTAVVDLLLPAVLVKHPVKAEADVLLLLSEDGHVRPLLKGGDGVCFWRVKDEDPVVEDLDDLTDSAGSSGGLRRRE